MEKLNDQEKMRVAFLLFSGSMRSGVTYEEIEVIAEKLGIKKEMEHWKQSWEFERPIIEQFLNRKKP